MTKLKNRFWACVLLCFCVVLIGCGSSNELVGTWEQYNEYGHVTWTFTAGNKFELATDGQVETRGTYEIYGENIEISVNIDTTHYGFRIDDRDTLVLINSNGESKLTRVR